MKEFGDENVPISCGECFPTVYVNGLGMMVKHIQDTHKNYSLQDAHKYAGFWLASAYEEIAVQDAEYSAHMRGRKSNATA